MDAHGENRFEIRPYSLADLARIYKINRKTFRKWLVPIKDRIGKRIGRYYNVNQIKVIIEHLGIPSSISLD